MGSYPDVPRANEIIAAWGTGDAIAGWPDNTDTTVERWSVPGLFIQSGRHQPDIVFARHDYAYDENEQSWYPLAGIPVDDLLSLIDANETQIEGAGVSSTCSATSLRATPTPCSATVPSTPRRSTASNSPTG